MELGEVVERLVVPYLEDIGQLAPAGHGDEAGHVVFLECLLQVGLELGFDQVSVLMLVGREEQEFGMDHPEVLVLPVDAALAQDDDLPAGAEGVHRNGPLF